MSVINGRTGQEIARGVWRAELKGYFFELPMTAELSRGDVCLVLRGADGRSLPTRPERPGDDGYAFRNPLWERELDRRVRLQAYRAELNEVRQRLSAAQRELLALDDPRLPPRPATEDQCVPGSVQPEPARPAHALDSAEAHELAGPFCAQRALEQLSMPRADALRLMRAAGLEADALRAAQIQSLLAPMAQVGLRLQPADLSLFKEAALRGPGVLQHVQGVARLRDVVQQCRGDMTEEARRALGAWEQARIAARNAPQLALQECQRRVTQYAELQRRIARGTALVKELEDRLAAREGVAASATEAQDVGDIPCREN